MIGVLNLIIELDIKRAWHMNNVQALFISIVITK